MMKRMTSIGALASALSLVASLALGAPLKGKPAAAPKCPVCHMTLSAKKDKAHPQAVKIKGKTYYCCTCDMSKMKH